VPASFSDSSLRSFLSFLDSSLGLARACLAWELMTILVGWDCFLRASGFNATFALPAACEWREASSLLVCFSFVTALTALLLASALDTELLEGFFFFSSRALQVGHVNS